LHCTSSAARVDKKIAKLRDELPKFESSQEMRLTTKNALAEKSLKFEHLHTQAYTNARLEQCTPKHTPINSPHFLCRFFNARTQVKGMHFCRCAADVTAISCLFWV